MDQPTGAVLLATPSSLALTMVRLDVDASRITATGIPANGLPTPRLGYLAYTAGSQVWAVAPDGSGPPHRLAAGDWLFAATDPGAIWVNDGATGQVQEVDGAGRVLAGPVLPPGPAVAAATAGIVVSPPDRPGVEVWNPATGVVTCRLTDGADAENLGSQANLLAWVGGDDQLHVTDMATCTDLYRQPATPSAGVNAVAAFSPDGRTLAVSWPQPDPSRDGTITFPFQLVDTKTGRVSGIPIPPGLSGPIPLPVGGIAWTADSQRLFWLYPVGASGPGLILTWRVGDAAAQPLHAVDLGLSGPIYSVR
jgi:hypothetical protein